MIWLPKSAWRYAVLIILLFAIVAVASMSVIAYMEENIPGQEYEQTIRELSVGVWSLTMGFMFMAGALGLWAIRSTVEIESRRRIGMLVDAMDYLSDGLFVLGRNGRIIGSNPAARQLVPKSFPRRLTITLRDTFLCLSPEDCDYLLDSRFAREIERDSVCIHGLRTFRFRSQPAAGLNIVIVSDVTNLRSLEIRQRQIAQLQLIGRIAGGVAYDFNNILCAISAHADLLKRPDQSPDALKRSADIISEETRKGALLSMQMLDMSRSGVSGKPSDRLDENVEEAADLLRVGLSQGWNVKTTVEGKYPVVPLTARQIEQVILNLGLMAADALPHPGTVMITLSRPGKGHLLDVGNMFAAVIIISAELPERDAASSDFLKVDQTLSTGEEGGVILSVVKSLVEEARGRMDHLTGPEGLCLYRVCLPHLDMPTEEKEELQYSEELQSYVSGWNVLLAGSSNEMTMLEKYLKKLHADVVQKNNIMSLLATVESSQKLDAIVVDKRILGAEADGLLKAMFKLCSHAGIVVICRDPEQESGQLTSNIVFKPYDVNPDEILQGMVTAKGLASQKK